MRKQPDMIFPDVNFGAKESLTEARFDGFETSSVYLNMKDGIRLAAEIILPKGLPEGEHIPTLLYRTRYWRAAEFKEAPEKTDPFHQFFTSYGYAIVKIDVRGTGASFGKMVHEWQPIDIDDAYEVVDWIIDQPWSNRKVGAYGISYPGTTAELLAATKHPAITSIWATYFELDGYGDIAFPGGVPSTFLDTWGHYTQGLDNNERLGDKDENIIGVKPVDADPERILLKEAVADHKDNNPAHTLMKGLTYRDEPMMNANVPVEEMVVYSKHKKIEESKAPIDIWGSWMDANTADTVIRHFMGFDNPQRAVINAWSHGGTVNCNPYLPAGSELEIEMPNQLLEIKRYMDQHFHGKSTGDPKKMLYYFTLGENKWKSTEIWPPKGSVFERLYLNSEHELTSEKPESEQGVDEHKVDFEATTGKQNRWWTELGGGPVIYEDRAEADQKLMVYESHPLEDDTEITGYPEITLYASTTGTDGAFFVYLEDVDPDGNVVYITEGILRPVHRKVSDPADAPYKVFGPYHSYKKADGQPVTPGEIMELKFALYPISALVRKGHKLRVAIAGADADTFHRLPETGNPVVKIERNAVHASYLDVPMMKK